jgi:hypothetical protein
MVLLCNPDQNGFHPRPYTRCMALVCFPFVVIMATQIRTNMREWVILFRNIRGINSEGKWNSIRNKVKEIDCEIIRLQETKRDNFDEQYIWNFCPRTFNSFTFTPSVGNSWGTIIIWQSSKF